MNTTARIGRWAWLALLLAAAVATARGGVDRDPVALLDRAEAAFDRAEAVAADDPIAARAAYAEAIAAYEQLIDSGAETAAIHRNVGTAHLLRGDLGRAIASLRRAERLDPTDDRVRDSLAAARASVRTEISPGVRANAGDAVFFWRGWIPRPWLLGVGLGAWAVAWLAAAARVRGWPGSAGLAIAGAVAAVLTLGSLGAERFVAAMNPVAVVVQDDVVGYRGPSEAVYGPTFEEPIRVGVEGTVVERRDGWTRLRLRSGAETWVRDDAVELV